MKPQIGLLSLALLAALCSGCATYDQHPAGHHIAVDKDGKPLGHVDDTYKVKVLDQDELSTRYIDPIIVGIEEHVKRHKNPRNPAKILLFIHGGLNGYTDGIEHVSNILARQELGSDEGVPNFVYPNLAEYYLMSLNWEAGLRSALFDHFFEVRAGVRDWRLATATFPFVFAGDVGQSIINMPRDLYYAYIRELALTQGPQFAKTGLFVGGIASFYGGIIAGTTDLLFKDIIFQSLIVAGGIYGSPVFLSSPSYYAFGPIRMLSAPFIDGFGTPAWAMLKHRTDFALHNPTVYSDNNEKGAGYDLLNTIAEKIDTDGRWKIDGGDPIPVELTLAGHSMGAIIVDRILSTFGHKLVFKHIIYMGAANSLADFQLFAVPYLQKHEQSRLWSFSLSDLDETNEHYMVDLIMRGSLLVWIEKFFEPQYSILQRRFGRETSQDYVEIVDKSIWQRTCRITLHRNLINEGEPLDHSYFTKPKALEHALSIINQGCPGPIDIKSATKEEFEHLPEFKRSWVDRIFQAPYKNFIRDDNWVDDIIAKGPYDEKEDLVDRQIISDFKYRCVKDFFTPVNINSATIEQLTRLLRGDRFLANKILKMKLSEEEKPYEKMEDLKKIIPDFVYEQIESKITTVKDPIPRECQAGQDIVDRLYFPALFSSPSPRSSINGDEEAYRNAIVSEAKKFGMERMIAQSDKDESPETMEKFWGAVLEIGRQRVGLDIHTNAQLREYGSFRNWWTRPDVVDEHSKSIAARAKIDGISTVFLVWNKNVFKWPGMTDMINSLKQKLGQTKLVPLYGSPQDVARAILATIQKEESIKQPPP